ncbi:hypothetical protein QBC46DRAFT_400971 [Diplogelasinospora grovesii]|uniref:WAP domain-containing protein n=1 Tax=Diplogelasinospora grovesii TaxID=303347 RepID=A0AAN6MX64_9PEZI|nr:hypothetical protein QBC46DRAFT_400971 [Diplogelasinospora grovesii]
MIFSIRLFLLTLVAATGTTAIATYPPARNLADGQPPCSNVPESFWICASDCLYKKCHASDDRCLNACNAACKMGYVPDCDPGLY